MSSGTEPQEAASNMSVTPVQAESAESAGCAEATTEAIAEPTVDAAQTSPIDHDELDHALTERQALVELCLYALDRARSAGVVERIEHGLAEIGVTALRPDGQQFDPSLHEAGGVMTTEDTALDGTVAETEVVGFTDRGRSLRAPIVIVYQQHNTA